MPIHDRLYIGGEWVVPDTTATFEVISPHTERPIARVPAAAPADVDRAVAAARAAFDRGPWPRTDPAERIALVRDLAARFEPRREEIAQLVTAEMGAPITFSRSAQARLPGALIGAFADLAEVHPGGRPGTGCSAATSPWCANRWVWWPRSSRGTCPCSSPS